MAGMTRVFWREYRCGTCGRLQFKGYLPYGTRIQIKCWHGSCGRFNYYKVTEAGIEYTEEQEPTIELALERDNGRAALHEREREPLYRKPIDVALETAKQQAREKRNGAKKGAAKK